MIDGETIRKLRALNLDDIVEYLEVQQRDTDILVQSFDDRMKAIVDYLYTQKNNKRIQRLQKQAKFRFPSADIYTLIYEGRPITREKIFELATCSFTKTNTNIVFQGYTGSGKTHLACAIGKEACARQLRTKYVRMPDLLMTYEEAVNTSSQKKIKFLEKYTRYQVLIIDEWLMEELSEEEEHFLFELTERRYDAGSTIFCTQYREADWLKRLGSNVHAEAIMDRIVHNAIWVETGKANMREYLVKRTL